MISLVDAGGEIRRARERAGLSQAALAARAGTSQATISAYEAGRKQPSVRTLSRMLAAMGAELSVAPAPPRRVPAQRLAQNGRRLVDVLALADALPSRHEPELRFPPLRPRTR